ncbi:hypothetical protein HOD41_06035 [bacterium]|jgi:hypothetical protein|nr:hypothetical protein [bacterium]MBT7311001.1 hypothetical protein [bacterium]
MNVIIEQKRITSQQISKLESLLSAELFEYRRLRRIAIKQNSYLRKRDVQRIEHNATEWAKYLPMAEKAKNARESMLVNEIGCSEKQLNSLNIQDLEKLAGSLPDSFCETWDKWKLSISDLERQNNLNGILARFCLELVSDELGAIKEDCSDKQDCYDTQGGIPGGKINSVITRRA